MVVSGSDCVTPIFSFRTFVSIISKISSYYLPQRCSDEWNRPLRKYKSTVLEGKLINEKGSNRQLPSAMQPTAHVKKLRYDTWVGGTLTKQKWLHDQKISRWRCRDVWLFLLLLLTVPKIMNVMKERCDSFKVRWINKTARFENSGVIDFLEVCPTVCLPACLPACAWASVCATL